MKSKKPNPTVVHDLRDIDPVKVAVADVSSEFAGLDPLPGTGSGRIASPRVGVQTPGQTTHE